MSKTAKRRRSTKHRGNAAGMIESRGRTGRKPTSDEKGGKAGAKTPSKSRPNRLDQPPTWRSAFLRAGFAAVLVLGVTTLFMHMPLATAATFFPIVLLIYVPLGYYTDRFLFDRRRRRQSA